MLEFNFGLNNIKFINRALKDNIEDQFYIFKSVKFPQVPKIIFLIVTLIDNTPLKNVLSNLITKLDEMKSYYLIIELSGMFVSSLVWNIMIIRNILKISRVIFDYQDAHENFLNKLESSLEIENTPKKSGGVKFNSGNIFEKQNEVDNLGYTKNEKFDVNNNNFYFSNDNSLLNELLMIYTRYYNITKEELIKKNHDSKRMMFNNNKNGNQIEENELNSKLNKNYLKSITKGQHENQQLIILTQSVIYELLSTEKIDCSGLITNFRFKYMTNINFNPRKETISIKNSMFAYIEKINNFELFIDDNNYNDNELLIEGDNKKDNIKILWREKNKIIEEFENNFENDDYLKKEKLNSTFDSFLINAYYKYLRKIIFLNNSSSIFLEDKFD
jgi:hypothetical protein